MSNILYLDPSISNFGYCISVDGEIVDYGHKRTYSKYELHERVATIVNLLKEKIDEYGVDTLVYEYPNKGRYHPTGIQTFIKLGVAIGCVLGMKDWDKVVQYTPQEWKNNMPKEETQLLLKSKGFDVDDNNTADAIAICIYDRS